MRFKPIKLLSFVLFLLCSVGAASAQQNPPTADDKTSIVLPEIKITAIYLEDDPDKINLLPTSLEKTICLNPTNDEETHTDCIYLRFKVELVNHERMEKPLKPENP